MCKDNVIEGVHRVRIHLQTILLMEAVIWRNLVKGIYKSEFSLPKKAESMVANFTLPYEILCNVWFL